MLSTASTERVSFLECFTRPLARDWHILVAGGAFFFACQYGSKWVMKNLSAKFRSLNDHDQDEWAVRFVSCVNGLLCSRQAIMYWTHGRGNGLDLTSDGRFDMYSVVPGQSDSEMLLASYFLLWDVVVCLKHNWGPIFLGHGICSGLATVLITWPFSQRVSSWFSGMFESSNALFHGAMMIESLDGPQSIVMSMKVMFSLMFLAFRPIGGSWVYWQLLRSVWHEHNNGYTRCHNPAAMWTVVATSGALLGLQWLWAKTIAQSIGAALGLCEEPAGAGDAKAEEKKKKKQLEQDGQEEKKKQ